ncbi:[protein-PII] uridylyltransferase [Maritalea myrionectae]|uniref:Bifunctional uridylyltransferase/uridylyl-removing enzyme n=1 Tax=Maritalea myrionectae TaxID=454601 RepID=A0A2R4M9T9_9HYPH|nr:[protein-PII] uridylyltransferase [Maritalea myrionectae]AVX02772.1 [Protein-PII] uridylyltransferase [Maritalea myrionectae]
MPESNRVPKAFKLRKADDLIGHILGQLGDLSPSSNDARNIVLATAKKALADARSQSEQDLLEDGKGKRCAKNLCAAQDEIIKMAFKFASGYVFPVVNRSDAETLTIAAVGGYGRGTLAPGSDIDLLFILPYKQTPWGESVTEYVLYLLWDLGQKVGHAVRSIDECIRMAKADMTVRTATLESRQIIGDLALYDELQQRFADEIVANSGPEFIAAKMAERDERHEKIGNTRFVVEPNIKDGKGGLRDLNTLFWIAKYFYRVRTSAELVKKGVFSRAEFRRFQRSEDFLWAIRCHLHFLTGRSEEKLSFELQQDLAQRLHVSGRAGLRPVERLMKRYFSVAKDVGDLTRIFCTSLEFNHAKDVDVLGRMRKSLSGRRKIKGEKDFVVDRGRINIADKQVFERDPVNLIKVFWVAGREGLLFHPDALKELTRSRQMIGKEVRQSKKANEYFLKILTHPQSVERILRRMNEADILGKFIPEFGRIVALMQFNMYHHYTVDEHLIRAVGVLAEIVEGGLKDELPLTHELLPHLADLKLLFVALFLHDIAKGRPEDHSTAGAKVARKLCPRFGLTPAETDTVAWLIQNHLVMSEISQSRDVQDPQTATNFADIVQSPARLSLLLVLTACDIRAVGPGVWTGWKGSLLRALYYATEPLLSGGHSQISQAERIEAAKERLNQALRDWPKNQREDYIDSHYSTYWVRSEFELQMEHAKMIRKANQLGQSFAGCVSVKAFEAITELSIYTPDHPRLLALIAGACTLANADIMGAQISMMRDGHALDTLRLKRTFTADEDERIRALKIIETVQKLLSGEKYLPKDLGRDSKLNKRLKPFSVPTDIYISNSLSKKFTVIEISGLDRTGLLHDLTQEIADLSLTIQSAHIGTYGEKAIDVFYVTDLTGMKITDKSRQKKIKESLLEVFAGFEREKKAQRAKRHKKLRAGESLKGLA